MHEDDLVAKRTGWMLVAQPFLFTAYGYLQQKDPESALVTIIPWIGPAVAVLVSVGVLAAGLAMKVISGEFRGVTGRRIDIHPLLSLMGWLSGFGLCSCFVICWAIVLREGN